MPKLRSLFSIFILIGLTTAFQSARADLPKAIDPSEINVAPGFEVDLVYTVPKEEQGSWVGLTVDPKGRIIASDQYGSLYRITPQPVNSSEKAEIEKLAINLPAVSPEIPESEVGAHGVLYAFDSLYVMVSEIEDKRGIWRFRDTNGDDQFDQGEYLLKLDGRGEHGPHSMVVGPGGKSIYFAAGNFTDLPVGISKARAVRWGEDHLLPRMWDARGHAKGRYAPGGYVGRCDPDGKSLELFGFGFRNHFDIAFDQNGELFTYDSDMEWDQGSPWYMPTRINHIVDGGDYGWRSGAGRWPDYYADSLPSTIDIGPGSPTGTVIGTGARFPAKYQHALYAADWTYGTLYAIHHEQDGSTFKGTKEEFVSGKPLPLTDVIVNKHDGALYFAVGGRRTQSALYRVTYTGKDSTALAAPPAPTKEVELRRSLEALHSDSAGAEAVDFAWPHLSHSDRFIRFAARVAIERQLTANWANRALNEKNPQAAIEALIAFARVGEKRYQSRIINALRKIKLAKQPESLHLPLLRAWHLVFTRMGEPDTETKAKLAAELDPLFPQANPFVNRELVNLLIYLDSSTIVEKTVPLLKVSEPQMLTGELLGGDELIARNDRYGKVVRNVGNSRADRQQIAYAYALRNATVGWTPELRTEFFSWFATTREWNGGASFTGVLKNIRKETLERVPDQAERLVLEEISRTPSHSYVAGAVAPKGPGQLYTVDGATSLFSEKLRDRDFARGKAMYVSTACIMCHRFGSEGAGVGPDLTGAGNRYTVRDLLENIIDPSRVISDQYGTEKLEMTDGDAMIGRVVSEGDEYYELMTNAFLPDRLRKIDVTEVASRSDHPVSMMPPGLINGLNPEELKDLIAYLLSGGNANDPMFTSEK